MIDTDLQLSVFLDHQQLELFILIVQGQFCSSLDYSIFFSFTQKLALSVPVRVLCSLQGEHHLALLRFCVSRRWWVLNDCFTSNWNQTIYQPNFLCIIQTVFRIVFRFLNFCALHSYCRAQCPHDSPFPFCVQIFGWESSRLGFPLPSIVIFTIFSCEVHLLTGCKGKPWQISSNDDYHNAYACEIGFRKFCE